MSNTEKKLAEIFDVDYVETPIGTTDIAEIKQNSIVSDTEKQEEYVKKTIIQMMMKGQSALEELHMIARDSEKSRDFEVLFGGMKTITELGEKLLETGKKPEAQPSSPQTVNQTAVFVGSTSELAKMLSSAGNQHTDSESHKS